MSETHPVTFARRVELLVGRLLRVGVFASLALLVAGTVRHLAGDAADDGLTLVRLGLIVLIATPVLRVIVSIVAFAIGRDWAFVAITSTVLALLGASLLVGR